MNVGSLLDFSGRAVAVTGAAKNLGRHIATRFAEAGAKVAVLYRSDAAAAKAVAAEIGGLAVQADLSDRLQVLRALDETVAAFGGLEVVINNAGIYPVVPLLDMTERDFDETIAANLKSVHLVTQAAAKRMKKGGAIVNITSIEAFDPAPGHAHYDAAKAAVHQYTKASALELAKLGIRVNAVAPGLIDRPGLENEWPDGVARYRSSAPLGALVDPIAVADACLFLTSEGARFITGASLTVDGGVTATQSF